MRDTATIRTVVVCDDVRREDNGKLLLIGVYGKDIGFRNLPANVSLRFWMELDFTRSGSFALQFRGVHRPSGTQLFTIEAPVEITEADRRRTLTSPDLPMLIPGPGDFVIEFRQNHGDWIAVKSLPLIAAGAPRQTTQDESPPTPPSQTG